jgi:hypothetical protein
MLRPLVELIWLGCCLWVSLRSLRSLLVVFDFFLFLLFFYHRCWRRHFL